MRDPSFRFLFRDTVRGFTQAALKVLLLDTQKCREPGCILEMVLQFLVVESQGKIRALRYTRALALLRHDNALALELEVGTFYSDDADLKIRGELSNRRKGLSFGPVAHGDAPLDLLHDLQIDRTLVRLRDHEGGIHNCIYY